MQIVKSERIIFVDCDDTLIMHFPTSTPNTDELLIKDPVGEGTIKVWKNKAMIRLVKEEAARGSYMIIWSRGGFEWASIIATALGLQHCFAQAMTKPYAYFDDREVADWMKDRVYLGPNEAYKTLTERG